MDSFRNLEDETFPSFLSNTSLGSSVQDTLGDVTLGSTLGVPMAASTVAKSRATADNRITDVQASYLEPGALSLAGSQGSNCGREKFALSFKDDLDKTDNFIPANNFLDLLVKVKLDESECASTSKASAAVDAGAPSGSARPSDYPDISTGLFTVSRIGGKESIAGQAVLAPIPIEEGPESEAVDSDGMSGSVASFLINEKLVSLDSMNSDVTDDDLDVDNLHDEELQLYFSKLIPPPMQRGRVEGQEIPAAELPDSQVGSSQSLVTEPDTSPKNRCKFLNDYDKEDFCMPDVRLAATGMDSCPASDEDTEDELEALQNRSRARFLLPSTSRQLVGESHQPHFRPGLEGGSSDDESHSGVQFADSRTGIEHRCSAEGQVIDLPITGDGGGGDGSSGSEEDGNDGGVSTVPQPASVQTTYDVLRGLGIVGGSGTGEDEHQLLSQLPGLGRFISNVHSQMGDRVGPVGTVETEPSVQGSGLTGIQSVNQSTNQDRQEALNAMDGSHNGAISLEERFDSMYLRPGGVCNLQDSASGASALQDNRNAFDLSFTKNPFGESKVGVDQGHTIDFSDPGLRGGPCRNSVSPGPHTINSEERLGESLEVKYLSQTFHQNEVEQSNIGNNESRPDDTELELQQGANDTHSVVYQNEDGKWVTDLAYYSSFEKEANMPDEIANQLQSEEFVGGGQAMEKIIEDQEEFEREHQFMQEEQIEAVNRSVHLGDTSWKFPTSSHILMRASQVSTEFEKENQSYLRISLGGFLQQRSEALGCLGGIEDIKRPSFGYIINSPEKREPFALIRPSDFSSRGSSVHSETVQLGDVDETMNPEDLEKTVEPIPAEQPQKGHANSKDVQISPALPLDHKNSSQNFESNSSGSLTLSVSTIASAIADASISSDPAQLAAMIMELSKKKHSKSRRTGELLQTPDPEKLLEQKDLQKALSLGDLSALDMEKYLKKAEVSSSDSDASTSQSCLDVLSLTDSLANSCKPTQGQTPPLPNISHHAKEHSTSKDVVKKSRVLPINSSKQSTEAMSEVNKSNAKRSSIPRPKTSCIPTATAHPARRSAGAGQSLTSSALKPKPVQGKSERRKSDYHIPTPAGNRSCSESRVKMSTTRPQVSGTCLALKSNDSISDSLAISKTFQTGDCSEKPTLKSSPHTPRSKNHMRPRETSCSEEARSLKSPRATQSVTKEKQTLVGQSSFATTDANFASPERGASGVVEASQCSFRPSTSPLTHSSPSQTSLPSGNGDLSPSSSRGMCEKSPGSDPRSPQSHCSSPSISRLTYLSLNENTTLPTPNHQKNKSMSLSTTIIRASPTPPLEPVDANKPINQTHNGDLSSQSSCHAETPGLNQQTSEHGSYIQNGCNINKDYRPECGPVNSQSESQPNLYTRVDSGYSSNLNVNNQPGGPTTQNINQVPHIPGAGSEAFLGSQFGPPPTSYKSEPLRYGLVPNYNSQGALSDLACGVPALLTGRSLFSTQIPQQYLSTEGSLQASSYHIGPLAGPYGVPAVMAGANPPIAHSHVPGSTGLSSVYMTAGQHPPQYALSKVYGQPSMGAWSARDLADLRTQVVVPDELKFPGVCCVGIACQTSLSIFNPSERWQQVAISIVNLSIDGEKVDSLPYQWLIVKNKTIIGPKSTEEQKVLLIAPKAGLYQCTLSVSSWPASAESETVAQAEAFAKKVVLVAVAENPAIEVDVGKTDCLDFGDLAGGSVKSLSLKMVNRTRATVPVRLVISANASAWHCFSFSKSPVTMTAGDSLHSGGNLSSISVINHVMHSSCGDNPDSFLVWVHFNAPQRFSVKSAVAGELGPPDEFSARVDIEVDSPGPSRVIQSVALRARSGTARIHAPKDLQTVCLRSPLGQSASQTLPLKNAGNIDVQLRLKTNDGDNCFTVKPEELLLRTGEEQGVIVSFTAQSNRKYKECLLTILVLPSGPQYEVVLKGEVAQGNPENVASTQVLVPHGEVPPILSNKQFMAWGGVTLGRAVQQKLVLRNNSPTTSQQLRLLIRGQDQDCFQLQSSFGPDERLTRSRELLIKPREDVAVHLLFAPTRVASMLAKLEIKQSAVRPSQPGVKFTIPLSGYGGTSNVILEELRKHADGYVATMSGIQTGRVSKLCVCVRNTGSRAAFIRAVPYSDLEKRTVMDSTVISLSPSQFVLKERTQEVITVVMKASCREQALCQSHTALLATICLFCGDEVSRQQFRKLLRIKPDVGKKALYENSLLKSISFDEPFLGEELIQEAYDLPQRPNEAHIFYGNMSKVILSLLGTVEASDSGESEHVEFVRASQHHATDSDSGLGTSERHFSNVSLDVLPVRGPPLCVTEPVLKRTESSLDSTWSIQPEQLVLTAPTITGAADTKHVRILNCSDRELRFELSWPAHCLTITPQHGIIEPQGHLQILISPNPSLATKSSMLPWSGQIYVQCDNQQKFIRVQIRQDLAMDISAVGSPSDRALCPLPPQAETPIGTSLKSQCSSSPQTSVEIKNRTVVFPSTCSGESSECPVEMENLGEEVRWYLSSFAPPYVKGVDGSGGVYRATYTAFRCERMSGMLGIKEKMQVPFTFLPRDGGDYAQFWDLECHPVTKPQQKSRIRFQLCGMGIRAGAGMSRKEDGALVRTDINLKCRKGVESEGSKMGMESSRRGVYAPQSLYTFPATRVGEVSTLKVNFRNNSCNTHELRFLSPSEPFYIKHSKYSLRTQHYINLPVQFRPTTVGQFSGLLHVQTDTDVKLAIELSGEALP